MFDFKKQLDQIGEIGVVEQLSFPVALVTGLPGAILHEVVVFENGSLGQIFMLERDLIQVVIFSKEMIRVGSKVARTDQYLSIPVGEQYLGKIINPLGEPLSQTHHFKIPATLREIDTPPLSITKRLRIREPLVTGMAIVDLMIPLGKGQKELVIGDRKSGKSSFVLTALKNQAQLGSVVIYAAIARKKSEVKKIENFLKDQKIEHQTIVVASSPDDSPGLISLTPYSAMTLAEFFRDQGQDVLVILDDLSTHARFYREISLVAKKFPGRDSYPGDIFYTHARLLERSGSFKHEKGSVAISVLPVVETIEGDITGYIPTNIMGMTDGHIFFDSNLYYQGRRPAINVALSVTRVGRQAQSSLIRSINHDLTAYLANLASVEELSHFGAELTGEVKRMLQVGEILYSFFEQPVYLTVPIQVQIILLSLFWQGLLENPLMKINQFRECLTKSFNDPQKKPLFDQITQAENFAALLKNILEKKEELLELCQVKN